MLGVGLRILTAPVVKILVGFISYIVGWIDNVKIAIVSLPILGRSPFVALNNDGRVHVYGPNSVYGRLSGIRPCLGDGILFGSFIMS